MKDNKNISVDINEDSEIHPAPAPKKKKAIGGLIMGIINLIITAVSIAALVFTASLLISGFQIALNPNPGWDGLGMIVVVPFSLIGIAVMLVALVAAISFFIVARFNRSRFFKISTIPTLVYNVLAPVLSIIAFIVMIVINNRG